MTKEWIEVGLRVNEKVGDFMIWFGGRSLLLVPAITIYAWKQTSRLSLHLAEMAERSYSKVLVVFDSLPYGGMEGSKLIQVEAIEMKRTIDVCNDILDVLEGKHGLLIGGSGDGKTTTAMYIAYSLGGAIKIYDADAAADEWEGLNVIGRGANFSAINEAMKLDLEELQQRTILRAEKGSNACNGMDVVTVAEEFPLLVGEVETAAEWLVKHGKRGRRVKKFILAIAQNDTVANFGIQGDAGVIDSFRMIRLGKKAIAYARKMKNDTLANWLQAEKGRLLVDDIPVQLPPYREIQRVIEQGSRSLPGITQQLLSGDNGSSPIAPENPPEATENQAFQPPEAGVSDSPKSLLERIIAALSDGSSDDWITKNICGCSGGNSYYKAKAMVGDIRGKINAE